MKEKVAPPDDIINSPHIDNDYYIHNTRYRVLDCTPSPGTVSPSVKLGNQMIFEGDVPCARLADPVPWHRYRR